MLGQRLMHVPSETNSPSIIPMLSLHAPLAVIAVITTNGQRLIVISYDKDGPEEEIELDDVSEDDVVEEATSQ